MIDLLASTVLVPFACAALALAMPARLARWCAALGSAVVLGIGAYALADFARHPGAEFRFVTSTTWSESFGASWTFGVDGIGAAMLALSGLIALVATIQAWRETERPRAYHALVLALLGAIDGVFVALDLLVFFVCWELMLAPMLALIGLWGGEQRRYAAMKFFVFTLAGSALMLVLIVALWATTPAGGRDAPIAAELLAAQSSDGGLTLHGLDVVRDASGAAAVHVPRGFDVRHLALQWRAFTSIDFLGIPLAAFGFLAVLIACLVKLPAVPLHTWLPHAHVQAPTAISVLLAGVLLKLGVFGLYRIAWPLFPEQAIAWGPALGVLGVVGILWGGWVALGQGDLKRLVAYTSVSHMGICLLGLASLTTAGAVGGIVQAVAHGLSSSLAFLLVGVVYERAHHRRVDGFGGIAAVMPRFAKLFLFASLAGAGLPALAGFVGEFLVWMGAFTGEAPFPVLAACAIPSVVVMAACLLSATRRVLYGPLRHPEHAAFADCDRRELAATLPLVVFIVLLGLWPAPLVDAVRPACEALVHHVRSAIP
ncbi:MAG: NADH-quinone oxidoreductase subunit M [Planctomycetes bacterium]|nr:NADH-quinone oxidoreductase subunit M [Planctomycetota bacterium]